ncbi:MAG: hypothetical protein AAGF23_01085 [Acidobacteriota bacterium]
MPNLEEMGRYSGESGEGEGAEEKRPRADDAAWPAESAECGIPSPRVGRRHPKILLDGRRESAKISSQA